MNDGPQSAAAVERLVRSLEAAAAPRERLDLLLGIADGVASIDARRALAYAQEAQEVAASLGDARAARRVALPAGAVRRSPARSRLPRCDAFDDALAGFEAARDDGAVAKTLRAISFVHDALGDSSRALDYQFRALAIDQRTGNDSSRAATLRMIGVVYSRTGDAASGLDFYRRSLALCTLPSDAIERGKTLNNIGINLKNLGQLDEAEAALVRRVRGIRRAWGCRCTSAPRSTTWHSCRSARATARRRRARCAKRSRCPKPRATATASRMRASGSVACALPPVARTSRARGSTAALAACERHNLKPTQFEVHEALASYFEQAGDPAVRPPPLPQVPRARARGAIGGRTRQAARIADPVRARRRPARNRDRARAPGSARRARTRSSTRSTSRSRKRTCRRPCCSTSSSAKPTRMR